MNSIKNSELVTNSRGAVYHLDLLPEEIADTIIFVGDPKRVNLISSTFDSIEIKRSNREIATHTGYVSKKRLTVISTGMGTDNIDIVATELDILANFDLKNRTPKKEHKSLDIIRLGTCGALQKDINVGSIVATHYALGIDGLIYFYDCPEELFEKELSDKFKKHVSWSDLLPGVYAIKASEKLEQLTSKFSIKKGITISAPGFYGPQGRAIRLPLKYPKLNELIETFEYKDYRINNFEMESSAIYGLGQALGHNTITLCITIANRVTGDFLSDYKLQVKSMVENLIAALI